MPTVRRIRSSNFAFLRALRALRGSLPSPAESEDEDEEPRCLQHSHEGDDIGLLLRIEIQPEHEVEELDGVFKG